MLWAFDSLYVGVNDYNDNEKSGLYRITDSNGDDKLDHVELLRQIPARGDHGVHAVKLSPDGEHLYLICGNNAEPTEVDLSRYNPNFGEDHLLPRMPDGRNHNRHRLAPAGIIYKVSPDGSHWEAVSMGYRNIFDADFNADGELFTYDADMEWASGLNGMQTACQRALTSDPVRPQAFCLDMAPSFLPSIKKPFS